MALGGKRPVWATVILYTVMCLPAGVVPNSTSATITLPTTPTSPTTTTTTTTTTTRPSTIANMGRNATAVSVTIKTVTTTDTQTDAANIRTTSSYTQTATRTTTTTNNNNSSSNSDSSSSSSSSSNSSSSSRSSSNSRSSSSIGSSSSSSESNSSSSSSSDNSNSSSSSNSSSVYTDILSTTYQMDDTSSPSSLLPSSMEGNDSLVPVYEDYGILSDRVTLFNVLKPQVIDVDKYASILIYCVGFPGNILSFIVWIQKRMRHSSGCYLAALALDDFIFLTLHVILELHMVWGLHPLNTPVICELFPIIFLAAQYMGPLLVLGFTTERYISICHPFTREKYCTVRRAKTVITILVASALGLSGVQGYFYTMQESLAVNGTYECGPRPQVSSNGNTSLLILWNLSIEILTFLLVPLAVLVLNVLVICEMRRLSRTEQVTLHGHGQRTSATTVMLLAVSFYLILTTLPVTIAYTLFYEFDYDFSRFSTFNQTLHDPLFQRWMTYELVLASIKEFGTTQYAFNIIFYVITGKIFRKELKRLFSKVLCGKISLSISRRYSSLRGSFRRDGSRTASTWVSINGHTTTDKPHDTETNV